MVEAETGPTDPAGTQAVLRLGQLAVAGFGGGRPGVLPLLDPKVHLAEVAGRDVRTDTEEHQAEDQVAHPPGGHPEQADEEHEEKRGKPDVVLEADDGHGGTPGDQDRQQGPGVEDRAGSRSGPSGW